MSTDHRTDGLAPMRIISPRLKTCELFIMVTAAGAALLVSGSSSAFKTKDDFDFDKVFASLPPQSAKPSLQGRGFSSTFLETSSAETTCESSADSAFYDEYRLTYIEAMAKVVKKSCSPKFNDVDRLKDDIVDFAFAWAEATATASATCESFSEGKAKTRGCAFGESSASTYQYSYADAHAQAVSEAFGKHCSCSNADAYDFAEASLVVELYTEVLAEAKAIACSTGNGRSSADAYVNCYAEVLVDLYATAAAEASIKAGCTDTLSKAKSLAKVKARKKPTQTCIERQEQSGAGKAETKGDAKARVDDLDE